MSLRNLKIAPRAFLGFAFIALLVIVLGVFAVNRMSIIRQASVDMEMTQLPSIGFLGNVTENVLRLRILSFRVLVNRDPAALQEAQTRITVLVDKVRSAQASYAALPAGPEEAALYKTFATTLDNYMQAQSQMLDLSRQNKLEEMRALINTRIKEGTDQMGEQLNKLVALNAADAKAASAKAGEHYNEAFIGIVTVAACSISLFCCCRPRDASCVTVLSSSAAAPSCVAEPAICSMVLRRLVCMEAKAPSKRAGSSLPSTSMTLLRLPPAMVSAASTARFSGVRMLRVNSQASSTVSNEAITATVTMPIKASL